MKTINANARYMKKSAFTFRKSSGSENQKTGHPTTVTTTTHPTISFTCPVK